MNEAHWHKMVETWSPRLLIYARQFLPVLADAEEAVQNAWIRFWRAFEGTEENGVAPLLYRCTRQSAIDLYRSSRQRRQREKVIASERDVAHHFVCPIEQEEWRNEVETALAGLSHKQREVVTMKLWGELTFAQIAKVLDESPNTVASRYRYALEHLRKSLTMEAVI